MVKFDPQHIKAHDELASLCSNLQEKLVDLSLYYDQSNSEITIIFSANSVAEYVSVGYHLGALWQAYRNYFTFIMLDNENEQCIARFFLIEPSIFNNLSTAVVRAVN